MDEVEKLKERLAAAEIETERLKKCRREEDRKAEEQKAEWREKVATTLMNLTETNKEQSRMLKDVCEENKLHGTVIFGPLAEPSKGLVSRTERVESAHASQARIMWAAVLAGVTGFVSAGVSWMSKGRGE